MVHHPYITSSLLSIAVAIALISSIGLIRMRDAYQRLHYNAPVVLLSSVLVLAAVWLESSDWQSRIKVTFIFLVLAVTNSVLSHATARAIRIREKDAWPPTADEKIPVHVGKGTAGVPPFSKSEAKS